MIVGAGASHDSLSGPPDMPFMYEPPPLTRDLASPGRLTNKLSITYPDAHPILSELRQRMRLIEASSVGVDTFAFEQALKEYLQRPDPNVPHHVAAMRFYLRDLLWRSAQSTLEENGGMTNYSDLVRIVFQWAAARNSYACFTSFNYDHLLEAACRNHFGFNPANPLAYTDHQLVSVLKPHGSVLWAWRYPNISAELFDEEASQLAIAAGEPATFNEWELTMHLAPVNVLSDPSRKIQHSLAYPALALPITGKSEFVWPEDQEEQFREIIPGGTFGRVLIIGWRAAEENFLPLLDRLLCNAARLLVVTGGTNGQDDYLEVVNNLGNLAGRLRLSSSPNGFSALSPDDWGWLLKDD